jgi:hypothetical protein
MIEARRLKRYRQFVKRLIALHAPGFHNFPEDQNFYVENGVTHLMLGFTGPDYDLSPLEELIAWRDSRNGG